MYIRHTTPVVAGRPVYEVSPHRKMAIPCGPKEDDAKKATRPGCEEASTSRSEPARRPAAQQADHHHRPRGHQEETGGRAGHTAAARSPSPTAKLSSQAIAAAAPSWKNRAAAPIPNAASVTADSGGLGTKKLLQPATAASRKKSGEGEGEGDPTVADANTGSGEVDAKKKSGEAPADANTDSGEVDPKKKSGEDPAPASDFGQVDPKKRLQADGATSVKKRGEEEEEEDPAAALAPGDKELKDETGASWVRKLFSRPWPQVHLPPPFAPMSP